MFKKILLAGLIFGTGLTCNTTYNGLFKEDKVEAAEVSIPEYNSVYYTIIDPKEKGINEFQSDKYVLGQNLENDDEIIVLQKENYRQGDKVEVVFNGYSEIDNIEEVKMMTDTQALKFMTDDSFWWNEWKDENRGKEGYVQTEDGTWVSKLFYKEVK